jgi:hypothetical protein
MLVRLASLTGERVSFHGLGSRRGALAATTVAYGGAALFLWGASAAAGHLAWIGAAFWPGAVYAVSFALYTAALTEGAVGEVSGFANTTVLLLFIVQPRWDLWSLVGMTFFLAGSLLLVPPGQKLSRPVLWMVLSGVAVVVGRLMDQKALTPVSLPYAASLFTSVLLWLAVPVSAYGLWRSAGRLAVERPVWSVSSAGFNALSYWTVLELLRLISPGLVEAVSALAGVGATAVGVVMFKEGRAVPKVLAAVLMTTATLMLLFSQHGSMG